MLCTLFLYIIHTIYIYLYIHIYIYTYTCILHICMSIYYDQWLLLYHCCPSPSLNARHGLEMWKTGEAVAERRCRGNSPQDPLIFEEIEDLRSLLNVVEGIKKPAFFCWGSYLMDFDGVLNALNHPKSKEIGTIFVGRKWDETIQDGTIHFREGPGFGGKTRNWNDAKFPLPSYKLV